MMATDRYERATPPNVAPRVLSELDVRRLHAASLALLGEDASAAEKALTLAPQSFLLAGQDPVHDVRIGSKRSFLAAGGPAGHVQTDAGPPRSVRQEDLSDLCRLADALPEVLCLIGPPLRCAELTPLAELSCCLESTRKHVQVSNLRSAEEAERAVRMARVLAGEALTERPPVSLRAMRDDRGAARVFARAGLPVGLVLERDDGDWEELDLARRLARHHAGVLAGCLEVETHAPGAAFFYLVPLAALSCESASEATLFTLGAMQLAAHVGLPVSISALATGARASGWQASVDNAGAALVATAGRGAVVSGAGTLCGGRAFSARQLVMDAEIFSWCTKIADGITVDDQSIALEVIKQVGIGGNYLGQRHTRRHAREVWRPRLLDRTPWDAWVASGREGSRERADALVTQLLESHTIEPPNPRVKDALARIVAESVNED